MPPEINATAATAEFASISGATAPANAGTAIPISINIRVVVVRITLSSMYA